MNKSIKPVSLLAFCAFLLLSCSKEAPQKASKNDDVSESAPTPVEESAPAPEPTPSAPIVSEPEPEPAKAEEQVVAESSESVSTEPQEHIVKGVITQWQPLVTFAQPGDTIKFTNMAGHDTASMEGMIPEGANPWQSKLGEEAFTVKVDKEGAYVYKCNPHITTGMVGVIVVGDRNPANLAQLEENAGSVKIGGNMVKRALRKLKKQLETP